MKTKDREYLIRMYNGTSTDDGSGEIETYEAWLERQLLYRVKELDKIKRKLPIYYMTGIWNDIAERMLDEHFGDPFQCNGFLEYSGFGVATGMFVRTPNKMSLDPHVVIFVEPQVNMTATVRDHSFRYKLQLTVLPTTITPDTRSVRFRNGGNIDAWDIGSIFNACDGFIDELEQVLGPTRMKPLMF